MWFRVALGADDRTASAGLMQNGRIARRGNYVQDC